MFIRAKEVKGQVYYQMVEGYRDGGKVRHRTIMSLGRDATIAEAMGCSKKEAGRLKRKISNYSPNSELRDVAVWRRQLTQHEERLMKLFEIAARYDLETKVKESSLEERAERLRRKNKAMEKERMRNQESHRAWREAALAAGPPICTWCAEPITDGGHVEFRKESYHYGDCEILAKRAGAKKLRQARRSA